MGNSKAFYASNEYINKTDEEIVEIAKQGEQNAIEYILDKYKDIVSMKINKYFIIGAEKEDIFQEGMIGLYKAIKNFNNEKQNSFKSFANLCIERQLITAIKTSNRQKHLALNNYISLNTSAYDEEDDTTVLEVLDSNTTEDPLDTLMKKEYYKFVELKMNETLSDFEKLVLHRYAKGESYTTISEKLDAPIKSIDNAIQRIRKKAMKNIED